MTVNVHSMYSYSTSIHASGLLGNQYILQPTDLIMSSCHACLIDHKSNQDVFIGDRYLGRATYKSRDIN